MVGDMTEVSRNSPASQRPTRARWRRALRLGPAAAILAASLVAPAGVTLADTPGTTLTVSPSTNLAPTGQAVSVSGSGFGPASTGLIRQCVAIAGTEECSAALATFTTNAQGLFGPVSVTVSDTLTTDGGVRTCSFAQPCSLYAAMNAQPQNDHAAITFMSSGLPPICTPLPGQSCTGNVALNAVALSSHLPCSLGSGPANAVDGAASNIYTDKWCVASGKPTLTLQLPVSSYGFTLSKIVVKHAGVAGENPALNTKAYRILTSPSLLCRTTPLLTVTSNTANQTVHNVSIRNVAQVQLAIDIPTQGTNQATRIYEVEVWGSPSTTPPSFCLL
jgi:hypothetical protein